jgi:exonuclease III
LFNYSWQLGPFLGKEMKNTGFKLWYTGKERSRNGVSILINKSFKNGVVVIRRKDDRIIMIKLVFRI